MKIITIFILLIGVCREQGKTQCDPLSDPNLELSGLWRGGSSDRIIFRGHYGDKNFAVRHQFYDSTTYIPYDVKCEGNTCTIWARFPKGIYKDLILEFICKDKIKIIGSESDEGVQNKAGMILQRHEGPDQGELEELSRELEMLGKGAE